MSDAEPHAHQRTALADRLLEAALPHVVHQGWHLPALAAAAADLGLEPGIVHAVFPSPTADLLAHLAEWTDRRMLTRLSSIDLETMKVRERISTAVRIRLEEMAGHEDAICRALALLAAPAHAGLSARALYRSADSIWRAAGDDAVDFNFYTKRGLLAALLTATTLFWVNDRSVEHAESWAFLDRRISDITRFGRLQSSLRTAFARFDCRARFGGTIDPG